MRKHGAKLLASMVNGLDDKDDPHNLVALEAMSSLSKLLDHVEERDVQSMLLHIAIRIRPFFDSVRQCQSSPARAFAGTSSAASPRVYGRGRGWEEQDPAWVLRALFWVPPGLGKGGQGATSPAGSLAQAA